MYEEIYAVVDNFHSRLDKMNALLKEWRGRGIFFPDKPIIELENYYIGSRISRKQMI